jgi:hypothetical protein
MGNRIKIIGAMAAVFALLHPALAVVIVTEKGQRIGGYVVNKEPNQITVRYRQADGTDKEEAFDLTKVIVLQAVKPERLTELKPDKPEQYRDYAEELAEKRDDPEAREAALRLFHIAAYQNPDQLARGCLLGMSQVARTPAEARRLRALAFLLDPSHSPDILKFSFAANQSSEPTHQTFVSAMQNFRRGRTAEALRLAQQPGVNEQFGMVRGWMSGDQFLNYCRNPVDCQKCSRGWVSCPACKGTGRVPGFDPIVGAEVPGPCDACGGSGQAVCSACKGARRPGMLADRDLQLVLQLEFAEEEQKAAQAVGDQPVRLEKWSTVLSTYRPAPVSLPNLETLTEWDPRKSRYADGKWVEP